MKARRSSTDKERLSRHAMRLNATGAIAFAVILATASASESKDEGVRLEEAGAEEFKIAGEQVTGAVCASQCHGWEAIFGGPRRVPRQWDFIVSDMVARGANATEDQFKLIRRYLKWSWGIVWINSASAQDLVAVLALPEQDARAVTAYRKEHGRFTDLESLKEVPGIDPEAIDAQADAIMFN